MFDPEEGPVDNETASLFRKASKVIRFVQRSYALYSGLSEGGWSS